MFNCQQFREEIIQTALKPLDLWDKNSEELLVMTCANESLGGTYLRQFPHGPALGIFQIEVRTLGDLWQNYLPKNLNLYHKILKMFNLTKQPIDEMLIYNLLYSAVMCRVFYLRVSAPIPSLSDKLSLAAYYVKYYNCGGKATIKGTIENYERFTSKQK
jgi:hypothetical protein